MRFALTFLSLAALALTVGCSEPAAVHQLLSTADAALASVSKADAEVQQALLTQIDGQLTTLDQALVSDLTGLADEEGLVDVAEVEAALRLYTAKRNSLQTSRQDLLSVLRKRSATLDAARQLMDHAQDLIIRNRSAWYDTQKYLEFIAGSYGSHTSSQPGATP